MPRHGFEIVRDEKAIHAGGKGKYIGIRHTVGYKSRSGEKFGRWFFFSKPADNGRPQVRIG